MSSWVTKEVLDSPVLSQRYVFSACMLLVAVAGLGMIFINTLTKVNAELRQNALTKGLWRFEPKSSQELVQREQRRGWYKLLFAGVMLAALAVSVLVRFLHALFGILFGIILLVLYISYLWYYWYFILMVPDVSKKTEMPVTATSQETAVEAKEASWSQRYKGKGNETDKRLPVTIVTGFLGSGKTTLVKNILGNTEGLKVLVIENEIGSEGIDHELLMQQTNKEDIILMNNGCICCTVRKDLLTTFQRMFTNDAFAMLDWIVIETTGLADPAPLIQSFYMDKECQAKLRLDSVLTVVDAKHLPVHLTKKRDGTSTSNNSASAHGGISEALLQISYADRILLNKVDLVSRHEITILKKSIEEINPSASILESSYGNVDISELLNIQAFDPKKSTALSALDDKKSIVAKPIMIQRGQDGKILRQKYKVNLNATTSSSSKGSVGTVSFLIEEAIDLNLFNTWISELLQKHGANLYRMKGILHMHGYNEQFVCHGIHMIFDGERGPAWGDKKRTSKIVFIGLNLNQDELQAGFSSTIKV